MEYAWHDFVGIVGVVMILTAYLMLQIDKMEEDDLSFSLLNLIGACAVLVSLVFDFNLSAFVMEAAWLLISFFGIAKWVRARRKRA